MKPPSTRHDALAAHTAALSLPRAGEVAELVRDWLAGVYAAAPTTAASYTSCLRVLLDWCAAEQVDPVLVRPRQASRFLEHLTSARSLSTGRVRTASAVNTVLTACAKWIKFAMVNEERPASEANPFLLLERPKVYRFRSPLRVSEQDISAMSLAAYSDHVLGGAMGALLIGLLGWAGLRPTDITRTDRSQISETVAERDGQQVTLLQLDAVMKWHNQQDRTLPPKMSGLLFAYLQRERVPLGMDAAPEDDPVFVHPWRQRRVNRDDLLALLKRSSKAAGVRAGMDLTTRDLRKWFITMSGEMGVPLEDRQRAAGHASPAVIQQHYDSSAWSWKRDPAFALEPLFDGFPAADDPQFELAQAMPDVRTPKRGHHECSCTPQWTQARVWLGPVGIDEFARIEVAPQGQPGTPVLDPPQCPACKATFLGPYRVTAVANDWDNSLMQLVERRLRERA